MNYLDAVNGFEKLSPTQAERKLWARAIIWNDDETTEKLCFEIETAVAAALLAPSQKKTQKQKPTTPTKPAAACATPEAPRVRHPMKPATGIPVITRRGHRKGPPLEGRRPLDTGLVKFWAVNSPTIRKTRIRQRTTKDTTMLPNMGFVFKVSQNLTVKLPFLEPIFRNW